MIDLTRDKQIIKILLVATIVIGLSYFIGKEVAKTHKRKEIPTKIIKD